MAYIRKSSHMQVTFFSTSRRTWRTGYQPRSLEVGRSCMLTPVALSLKE